MAFTRFFDGKNSLKDLERSYINIVNLRQANLVNIQGRLGNLEDKTQIKANVATFEPTDNPNNLLGDLVFLTETQATPAKIAEMAAQGRRQIGEKMTVFIEGNGAQILVFGKK